MKIARLLLIFYVLTGCNTNNDKTVKGRVVDSLGNPIPKARVEVLSWTRVNSGEETYDKIDTITDIQGRFEINVGHPFKIDVGSIADRFYPSKLAVEEINPIMDVTLKLLPVKAIGLPKDFGEILTFNRWYSSASSQPSENYGIDFTRGVTTKQIDSIDLTIKPAGREEYSKILIAKNGAGISPIFDNESSENVAPENGYLTEYALKGGERGFFIRCRNGIGFARLKLISTKFDASTPVKDGFYKDYGMSFNVIFQPSGREIGLSENFRMDYFLIGSL